eukprot:scpid31337/ scgid6392/ 
MRLTYRLDHQHNHISKRGRSSQAGATQSTPDFFDIQKPNQNLLLRHTPLMHSTAEYMSADHQARAGSLYDSLLCTRLPSYTQTHSLQICAVPIPYIPALCTDFMHLCMCVCGWCQSAELEQEVGGCASPSHVLLC